MTDINKQRFLAELGKLLTFMYEEDRQTALAMYSDMFDSGVDEQTLMHQLVSPTRQAVVIARAYNQRERTLQTAAPSRRGSYYEESMDDVPGYVIAIEDIRRQALGAQESARIRREQAILFDEAEPVKEEKTVVRTEGPSAYEQTVTAAGSDEAPEESEQAQAAVILTDKTVEETEEESAVLPVEEYPQEVEKAPEEKEEELYISEDDDAEEIYVSDDAEKLPLPQEEERREDAEEESAEEEQPVQSHRVSDRPPALHGNEGGRRKNEHAHSSAHETHGHHGTGHRGEYVPTERRARPLLLILYVLFAVPVGLVGGLVLLMPIMFFLTLTIFAIWLGVAAISTAFGGFAMFSDVMVVLGSGLVLLALGLLFLWLFVWFIGGVLAGFINGLISLGGKLCYKEVEVE